MCTFVRIGYPWTIQAAETYMPSSLLLFRIAGDGNKQTDYNGFYYCS